jgi:hypothetical protein
LQRKEALMTIAIINETSAADRNEDIRKALEGRNHRLLNCGMKKSGEEPQLTYIQTGFLSALLLNLRSQQRSAALLSETSQCVHRKMSEIVMALPDEVVLPVLGFPGVRDLIFDGPINDNELKKAIEVRSSAPSIAVGASAGQTST